MWALRVDTFEDGNAEPVLTHLFYGHTQAEARAVLGAHIKYDAFLRASLTTGRFKDFPAHSVQSWSRS